MHCRHHAELDAEAIVGLFRSVFTAAEGAAEGQLIGQLACDLLEGTGARDLFNCIAEDAGRIVGSIFLSRLVFDTGIEAFLLAPVAVHTDHQGRGVGQALVRYGLRELQQRGVDAVFTYGDPRFYAKVGFRSLSEKRVKPPFVLSQPAGWLGQSLTGVPVETLGGACSCIGAFDDPAYW